MTRQIIFNPFEYEANIKGIGIFLSNAVLNNRQCRVAVARQYEGFGFTPPQGVQFGFRYEIKFPVSRQGL